MSNETFISSEMSNDCYFYYFFFFNREYFLPLPFEFSRFLWRARDDSRYRVQYEFYFQWKFWISSIDSIKELIRIQITRWLIGVFLLKNILAVFIFLFKYNFLSRYLIKNDFHITFLMFCASFVYNSPVMFIRPLTVKRGLIILYLITQMKILDLYALSWPIKSVHLMIRYFDESFHIFQKNHFSRAIKLNLLGRFHYVIAPPCIAEIWLYFTRSIFYAGVVQYWNLDDGEVYVNEPLSKMFKIQNEISKIPHFFFGRRFLRLTTENWWWSVSSKKRVLAPLMDSILVEAAHQPQFAW